jgi:glycosyltransferase involved in cell wall biosynthesis
MPAVSVVVPCYNGGRFIDGLLASLAGQIFRDFEIIIVDDGSTETATREKLAALDPAIRVVRQENRGLPGARNTGFAQARGELVLPLDCDDRLEPPFLAETTEALMNAPAEVGLVYTDVRLTGALDGVLPRSFNRFDQLFLNHLPCCLLMRKSAWAAVGGYDETMRDGYEDWEFNIRLAAAGIGGIGIHKPLFIYLVSPDGMLMGRSARMHGRIWQVIRSKHRALYRVSTLLGIWSKSPRGRISLPRAVALLAAAKLLPVAWLDVLFYRLLSASHERRVARRELRGPTISQQSRT